MAFKSWDLVNIPESKRLYFHICWPCCSFLQNIRSVAFKAQVHNENTDKKKKKKSVESWCPKQKGTFKRQCLLSPTEKAFSSSAPNQKFMFYTLTCSAFCPYRLFCSDLQRFLRSWLLRCLPPLKHNGTWWHSACGAQNAKKINLKCSTARSQLLKIFHRPHCQQ